MPKIFIDNKEYEVKDKQNLLEACLSLKLDLPYFCWHPAMDSVGACRQCAITKYRDESDTKGKIFMACMEPVVDGMRVSINDEQSRDFRKHVIEWLMTNHPHDCPVCDEGGECHLQDMTVMTGHTYRNHRYKKRTYHNQYLGPFINHEMNRCIQCYRCVRFYRDYADGRDFNALASRNYVYFGRSEDGVLENEFSGNLVEVCPTGVFTDKTLKKHYTRKWDLTYAPSICHNCSVGCNIIIGERYSSLRRVLSRYNGKVNGYFICDRGRFGYEWVNSSKRIRHPFMKDNITGIYGITKKNKIINAVGEIISKTKTLGIGSPKASLESNFALRKLVGAENFYSCLNQKENNILNTSLKILRDGKIRTPSLKEVEDFDTIIILGEDLTNTAPMLALSVRQSVKKKPKYIAEKINIPLWNDAAVREAVQDEKGPLYIFSSYKTRLDDVSKKSFYALPDNIARLGFAIANQINNKTQNDLSDDEKNFINQISDDLTSAEKPLIITGFGSMSESVIQASYNLAIALHQRNNLTEIVITQPDVNSLGLAMMNALPVEDALNKIESGECETLIILENNLLKNIPEEKSKLITEKVKNIIVLSSLENETTANANFIIPAGTFAESDGTVVNYEGRAQRFYQCSYPKEEILESWRWLSLIGEAAGREDISSLKTFDDFVNSLTNELPQFKGIENASPPSGYKIAGQKIPREPHRYSGRTAMYADKNINEPKPPDDVDSPLAFSMEGYRKQPPSSVIPFFWAPGWNSAQSINKYQIEVGGPLHDGDPGIRLIEPNGAGLNYFIISAEKFERREGEFLLIPVYHIYGSEEFSSESPAVQERIPQPYLAMNNTEAEKLQIRENENISITINEKQFHYPLKILKELPDGVIGFPVLQNIPVVEFNKFIKVSKVT